MTLGEKLKAARLARGLSQRQLAGDFITRNMLSQIENGSATPSVHTLEYLSEKLECPLSELLGDTAFSGAEAISGLAEAKNKYGVGDAAGCLRALDCLQNTGDEALLLRVLAELQLASQACREGAWEQAFEGLARAAAFHTQSLYYSQALQGELLMLQVRCAGHLGRDTEQLLREYQETTDRTGERARYHLTMAEQCYSAGNAASAEAYLSLLTNVPQEEAESFSVLSGAIYLQKGDYKTAAALLERVVEQVPQNRKKQLYAQLEECWRELGDYEKAYRYAVLQRGNGWE